MSRLARIILLAVLLVGVWSVAAQEVPLATEEPLAATAFPTLPPAEAPTAAPEVPTAAVPENPTAAPAPVSGTPTPNPLGVEQTEALPILINARADLELLATAAIGSLQRPIGWSGSIDVTDPQLPLWIRLDLETLAGAIMGNARPEGWFGVVPSIPLAVARDIRHDLELLADQVVGSPGLRPAGWKGDDPLMRCDRATQSLITLLQSRNITIPVDFAQADYCVQVSNAASRYVERQILQPPVAGNQSAISQSRFSFQADNPFVIAYLDRKARQKIGILPPGTGFDPVARSYADFSNMMLVRGDNFQVFVDYTTTPVKDEEFQALPDVGTAGGTDCQAAWCGRGLD